MNFEEKKQQLFDRLNQNLADYHAHIMGLDKWAIIDNSRTTAAMNDAHFYMTEHHEFEDSELDYLLNFQNPLEVVADTWKQRTDDISDMSFALNQVFDRKDALQGDYPLISDVPETTVARLQKFMDINVFALLQQTVSFYGEQAQLDFQYHYNRLRRAADSEHAEDKSILWSVSEMGASLSNEREIYITETGAHIGWTGNPDSCVAYAIEITGMDSTRKIVSGNVYELDYQAHKEHVRQCALPFNSATITYDDGREITVSRQEYYDDYARLMDDENGIVNGIRFQPEDESALTALLSREHRMRELQPTGNLKAYQNEFANRMIQTEAERIMAAFKELSEPNSPNKTHYMVKISPALLQSNRMNERLFDMLPHYKTKSFSAMSLKGEKGIYVFIGKDENRDKPLRIKKPSVVKGLKDSEDKQKRPREKKPRTDKGEEL